ncbi:unnamed protein product [Ascophyllum nodosum]
MAIPVDVLMERLRCRENVPLATSAFRCNEMFQEFLEKVRPALEFPHTYSSPKKKPSKEEVRQAAEKAIKEIRVYGFELRKAEAIEKTSARDMSDYSAQRQQISDGIKGVQDEIGQLKEGLVMERRKRHRKEVYEEHCKDINTYPPHRATKLATEKLERELAVLDERRKAIQAVQRLKQKQVALIMQSVADVQAVIDEAEAEEGPIIGALEVIHQEEEVMDAGAEVDGDGDADDRDEETNAEDDGDGEVEEEGTRRNRRKRSPSADSDEGLLTVNRTSGSANIGASGGVDDEELPDVA